MVAEGAWRCVVVTDCLRRFLEVSDGTWRCVVVARDGGHLGPAERQL